MATERMYDLAFQYKATKLWKLLYDDELFAVKLSDGEIGYCSVMGMVGQHLALGLYVGEEGYQSYRILLDGGFADADSIMMGEVLTSQNCLQCSFENKDMLLDAEVNEVRQYARAHQIPLRGKNAFPQFTKYRPGRYPWRYDSDLDEQRISDALSAGIRLKELLQQSSKEDIGLYSLRSGVQKIPLLSLEEGRWTVNDTPLPSAEISYPTPAFMDDFMAARLKRKKKRGIWECGTMRLPTAVQEEGQENEAPYFPLALVCIELNTGLIHQPVVTDGENAAETMQGFAEQLLHSGSVPRTIRCGDDRSFAILKDICSKNGIRLERTDNLEELDEAMHSLLEQLGEDENGEPDLEQLQELAEMLMLMTDGELAQMPPEMVNMLCELGELGGIPEKLLRRLKKLRRRL